MSPKKYLSEEQDQPNNENKDISEEQTITDKINSIIEAIKNKKITSNKKVAKKLRHLVHICTEHGIVKDKYKDPIKLLAFDIDVDAVLQHLKQDMRDDWFVDVMQHKDLIENKHFLHENLQSLILDGNGQYLGNLRTSFQMC